MHTVVEKIQQARYMGIALFDEQGELCQLNTAAAEILWNEKTNKEIYDELAETVRLMSSTRIKEDRVKKVKFDANDCEIICTIRRVLGARYRVILKMCAHKSMLAA